MEEKTNKVWKIFGTFETFEEADLKRNELLKVHELVKVKRLGPRGDVFKVKFWSTPIVKETKKRKKRKSKNVDQQIRN